MEYGRCVLSVSLPWASCAMPRQFRSGLSRWLVAPAVAVPLVACGGRLDITALEATIKADIERQGRRLALQSVRCPRDVPQQAGAFFDCVGEIDPARTFMIRVTQQDDRGTVTWEVPNSKAMLNLVQVEAGIEQGLAAAWGQRALVDCGEATYRVNQPGDRFECRVVGGLSDGDDSIFATLVMIDAMGNLNWQELRTRRSQSSAAAEPPQPPQPSALPLDSPVPGPSSF